MSVLDKSNIIIAIGSSTGGPKGFDINHSPITYRFPWGAYYATYGLWFYKNFCRSTQQGQQSKGQRSRNREYDYSGKGFNCTRRTSDASYSC